MLPIDTPTLEEAVRIWIVGTTLGFAWIATCIWAFLFVVNLFHPRGTGK